MKTKLDDISPTIKTWYAKDKWHVKIVYGKREYTSLREFDSELEAIERAKIFIGLLFK